MLFVFTSIIKTDGTFIFSFQNAAGGILGLVIGMLVETLIFIIQASRYDLKSTSTSSTSRLKKDQ